MPEQFDPEKFSEPSVLDYVKAQLRFWDKNKLSLASNAQPVETLSTAELETTADSAVIAPISGQTLESQAGKFPWLSSGALAIALLAQYLLEPSPNRSAIFSTALYLIAALLLILAALRGEIRHESHAQLKVSAQSTSVNIPLLAAGGALAILAFFSFKGGSFTLVNTFLWLASISLVCLSLWDRQASKQKVKRGLLSDIRERDWQKVFSAWRLLLVITILVVAFFRLYQLRSVPPEMTSDQMERILAVAEVMDGKASLFFPRNTISEPFQYYWAGLVFKLFGMPFSFYALKLANAIAGLLALVYLYKLANLLTGRLGGLFSLLLCGVAFWPNIQARAALGSIYILLFLAPSLFYYFRGLQRNARNDYVLAGLAVGLGLMASRTFLIVPLFLLLATLLFILHREAEGRRTAALWGFLTCLVIGLILFVPIMSVIADMPYDYFYRLFSRVSDWERALPGNAALLFLKNMGAALSMFNWSNVSGWVDSISKRPALDFVSAALFILGVVLTLIRYIQTKKWTDLLLVLSVPVLLLPSALSLAFPEENPSMSRALDASLPTFILAGSGLAVVFSSYRQNLAGRKGLIISIAAAILLLFGAARQNYRLTFTDYKDTYRSSSWNASEMALVIREFGDTIGAYDAVWVMGYPHWVDARIVALEAGKMGSDLSLLPQDLPQSVEKPGAKLFLLHSEDKESMDALQLTYPQGFLTTHYADQAGKNFLVFLVPYNEGGTP